MIRFSLLLMVLTVVGGPSAFAVDVDFSHQIVPVFKQYCAECHAGDKKKGSFSLNTRESTLAGGEAGKAVTPGKSAQSELLKRITTTDAKLRMPPKGPAVPADKAALVKAWIDEGAKWEDGFSFGKKVYEPPLKPRRPELPAAADGRSHPLDRIIDAYFAKNKQSRPALIDDAGFYRRLSLDLHGLLPDPAKVREFVRNQQPDKRAQLVRQLLAEDTAYAEHWLTFWNDLLRNDYSGTGFITGGRKQITPWLYRALIDNKRYDQMVSELVAPNADSDGFAMGIRWRGEVNSSQTVEVQYAQNVAQAFLGINLKCASCHDSFIDRWKLDEAYSIAAAYSTTPLEIHRCDKPTGRKATPAWLFPELGQITATAPQPERLKQLAKLMTHPENGRLTRTIVNRFWHRLMGRGIVHPVDAMQTEPWSADLLDYLAVDLADNKHDLKKTLELIATSQAYQMKTVTTAEATPYVFAGPIAKRMTAEQFVDCVWQITGTGPNAIDAAVTRGKPTQAAIDSIELNGQLLRLPESPKTGGNGSPSITLRGVATLKSIPKKPLIVLADAGKMALVVNGQPVKDPQIVQRENGVTVFNAPGLKAGENEILLSGPVTPAGLYFQIISGFKGEVETPAEITWKWAATAVDAKGKLTNPKAEWAVIEAKSPLEKTDWLNIVRKLTAGVRESNSLSVRSSLVKADFLMRSLGRPNRDQIVTMRPTELTTLEAIDLANHPILTDTLERGAKNIVARKWASPDELIGWLYQFALSRSPGASEAALARELLGTQPTETRVQDLLWAVIMLPEFQLIH
ncbi:DUF1549 domain-containing protein [Zavarzinella formosa]|uniref:DUF1549 domain-containing protein n=1 Tax=Zavarzinella formosa TaxID=360055 RepID=UPI0002FBD904|nr:DUF1549 domain-containing protein [Zavarzinella formosa]